LGFNNWFSERVEPSKLENFELARVIAVHKESYVIRSGKYEAYAEITGKMMFSSDSPLDFPTVGDWCYAQFFDRNSPAIIHDILPRRSELKRKAAGRKIEFQLIASNIDTALIIQAVDADFNLRRFERYLAMTQEANIEGVFLLSKQDLNSSEELEDKKQSIKVLAPDIPILAFSNVEHTGLDNVREILLPRKTFCLLGSSGVGKTTLLNNLLGGPILKTSTVREKDGKGKHTTTNRQLLTLENGAMMIDTPGLRELASIGAESGIGEIFEDITDLESQCRFNDCSHTQEKGCGILRALNVGTISQERFQNYVKMNKESEFNKLSYLEKRNKDKKLGKMYKSVQKHNVKK